MTEKTYKPSKILMASVIIMGLLIIIGTTLLLTLIFQRMTHHPSNPDDLPSAFVQRQLPLAANAHIKHISAFGTHQLALLITRGDGEKVIIWDFTRNQIVATLDSTHTTPP